MTPYGTNASRRRSCGTAGGPSPDLADELLEDVRQYTHGAEQYDDITFVLMRVT